MRLIPALPLALLLALAGCKTTSTSPSLPQPPASPSAGAPPAASSPSSSAGQSRSAGGGASEATAQGGTPRGAQAQGGAEAAEDKAHADGGEAGKPSDQVTLEESANAAAGTAGESADAAKSEQEVLDAALEAMQRQAGEPSLEEGDAGDRGAADAAARAGGSAAPAGAGSAAGDAEAIRAAVEGLHGGQGGSGELDKLNREMNESLARFDGAMLSERERSQARNEETGGSSATAEGLEEDAAGEAESASSYGTAMPAGQGGGASGAGTANDSSSGSGMSSATGGSGRRGDFEHSASNSANVPADIPDGSDDDVVARQIREAAMKEKDPELREKLWDEYRKYTSTMKRKS